MSTLATWTADAPNNPAARRDDAEIPCPEKRLEIIAAERCVQNTACPRAATCELRTIAIKLTRKARAPETAPKRRLDTGTKRRWKKACAMCPRDSLRGQTVCSDRCRDELAVYQASTRGGPGAHEAKTGKFPTTGFEFAYGRAFAKRQAK